jgi:hypothetical protein
MPWNSGTSGLESLWAPEMNPTKLCLAWQSQVQLRRTPELKISFMPFGGFPLGPFQRRGLRIVSGL